MSLSHYIRLGLSMPPHIALKKMLRLTARVGGAYVHQVMGRFQCSYMAPGDGDDIFYSAFHGRDLSGLTYPENVLRDLSERVLDHRFDVLGSGWVAVGYDLKADGFVINDHCYRYRQNIADKYKNHLPGLLSPGNRKRGTAIRALIHSGYQPIEWQVDFKSGYRWSENRRSNTLRYGNEPGVDVKVPWELARMHHLPWLAFAYRAADAGAAGFEPAETYCREFCNQVLDFAAANPPGFGVNWLCTMDVAIRVANILLAFDLLKSFGARFDKHFMAEFTSLIRAHGKHIRGNPEWHDLYRANHYLADIAGLGFAAVYLSDDPLAKDWLNFAKDQLSMEAARQFTPDGANFEASTSYHRLSAEMVVYAAALIVGYHGGDTSVFPDRFWTRLEKMADFSKDITKPDGNVVQIGDNDSGRFFKILPAFTSEGVERENHLDHRSTVAAINGFLQRPDLKAFTGPDHKLCGEIVALLAGGAVIQSHPAKPEPVKKDWETASGFDVFDRFIIKPGGETVFKNLTFRSYADFGIYIWSSKNVFFSVRLGPVGQNGNGGHAHNDQLSFELMIDGENWVRDPGTLVYTPDATSRNGYRSVMAHSSPRPPGQEQSEPSRLDLGLFKLENNVVADCLRADADTFIGQHKCYKKWLRRSVIIKPDRIEIRDEIENPEGHVTSPVTPEICETVTELQNRLRLDINFSPGYGLTE